ncbi:MULTISPECIES: AzlD domain-containing protein [unclassified Herbaspirillum]|uniref:AzlD domain-containing protein n=1 Tax=unclassified Herbaspirillum TaxID=2624150 RepID=UPI001151962E|nr:MULTISPECIES: AzlD domain-containing protein [unclassified Herbaspirillum]MBB5392369.1 branched-subunit amino acid transport protein [Herbaspirillum sp. SJZ102]TQK06010.1 branched-subunit amino acid transport protein [Herbaspirillum sp. SJZ130]TQK12512.1 branched-subunit amino acid transport protein [Herbaspirillum sp. SJZ106]TWC68230.1 branched-subunit amino acid transport protein [Herbaspirillum sp. SJZ099]
MSDWYIWAAIALMTLSTLITRSGFFLFGHAVKLPPRLKHALSYAPAAAMAAIVIPDLVAAEGIVDVSLANPKLLAGIGGAIFFIATRHLLGTIVAGMALFTILRLIL